MNLDFLRDGLDLPGGKVVHGSCYFHVTHDCAKKFVQRLEKLVPSLSLSDFNVLRIGRKKDELNFSISHYERFLEEPIPVLVWSQKVGPDLKPKSRRYEGHNPAVLHRKELLLPLDHPQQTKFRAFTAQLEEAGVLPTKEFIGRRDHWKVYLKSLGYEVSGYRLMKM